MLIAVLAMPLLMRVAAPLGLMDQPNARKVHVAAIPRIGGIAVVFASLLPLMVWGELPQAYQAYVLGALCLLVFGVWDDRSELNYKWKLLGQILAIAIFVIYGQVRIQWLPFQGLDIAPLWLSIFITFFALLGITNAVNLVDGLDGLAGGTSLLSLGTFALLALMSDDALLAILSFAICGAVFGFLRYNTHPATIFLGDAGSQFLGYSIGAAALLLTQQSNSALSPVLPLILLGLPILDTLTVMARRIMARRSPFSPDKNHFHHRLIALGFAHYQAVIVIYLVQICLIMLGFGLRYQSDAVLLAVFLSYCLLFNRAFYYAERSQWSYQNTRLAKRLSGRAPNIFGDHLRKCLSAAIRPYFYLTVPVFVGLSFYQAQALEGMSALYALMLLLAFTLLLLPGSLFKTVLARVSWYCACGLAIYCGQQTALLEQALFQAYMFSLVVLVLTQFYSEKHKDFAIDPLDVVVLACGGLALYVSATTQTLAGFGVQITYAVILLYVVESMLGGSPRQQRWSHLGLSLVFALGLLAQL